MGATKRTCLCCGKIFKYCPSCGNNSDVFNSTFDSKACAELFNAVSGYNMNISNANNINNVLIRHNITDFNKYNESISSVLFQLFPNMSEKKNIAKVEDIKTEEAKTEETPIVTTEEKEPVSTNTSLKNRFSKRNKSYQAKEVELSDKTNEEVESNTGISEDE